MPTGAWNQGRSLGVGVRLATSHTRREGAISPDGPSFFFLPTCLLAPQLRRPIGGTASTGKLAGSQPTTGHRRLSRATIHPPLRVVEHDRFAASAHGLVIPLKASLSASAHPHCDALRAGGRGVSCARGAPTHSRAFPAADRFRRNTYPLARLSPLRCVRYIPRGQWTRADMARQPIGLSLLGRSLIGA